MKVNRKKAVTLLELILAVSISSAVFLGLTAIYVTSGRFYKQLLKEGSVAEDLIIALTHISSRLVLANQVTWDGLSELEISGDLNGGDPFTASDDETVTYSFDSAGKTVKYNGRVIASSITGFAVTKVNESYFTLALTAEDPRDAAKTVTITSGVNARCTAAVTP